MFIEANPQFKTLNVYDDRLKKVFIEASNKNQIPNSDSMKKHSEPQKESEEPGKKQEKKKEANQEADDDSPKKGRKGKMRMGV